MSNGRWHWLAVLLIGVWGATPLLWFLPGHFIHTTDLELPVNLHRWQAFATTWNSRWGTGAEWSIALPAVVSYAVPAVASWLTGSLLWAQRVEFVVWFLLPGLSMYTLMVFVTESWTARLVATHFYMFNLFLASQWPGGLSALIAYALFPWVILLMVRGFRATQSWWVYAVALGLLAGAGAGIGVNFAQAYVFVLGLLLLVGCYLFAHRGTPEGSPIRCLAFFGVAIIIGLGCNSFWIFPQAAAAKIRIADPAIADMKSWSTGWLEGISTNASLPNVLRLQGDWTWFQGWKEPYVTYAAAYRSHPALIALSWLAPLLALIGCLAARGWFVGYCALTAIVGLVWSTGVHPPFRPLYLWCVQYLPLFWIIRSPWFKFTLLTSLGYAVLGGLAAEVVGRRLGSWWRVPTGGRQAGMVAGGVAVVLIAAHSVYAYPLIVGRMFPKPSERQEVTPSHAAIPDDVHQAAAWINQTAPDGRFLCLPYRVNGASVYRWGFSGLAPILSAVTDASFLLNSPFGFAMEYGSRLAEDFYAALYSRATPDAVKILRLLGVQYLLQEDDVAYDYFETRDDDPQFIRQRLRSQSGVVPVRTIGPREIYAVTGTRPLVYVADRVIEIAGAKPTLVPLAVKGRHDILEEPGVRSGVEPLTVTDYLDGLGALVFPAEWKALAHEAIPISDVVVYDAPPLDAATQSALEADSTGLTVFATPGTSTEELAEGRLPPKVCALAGWSGLGPLETWPDGTQWRWQTYAVSGQPCILLDNRTSAPLVTNAQIPIATYRSDRDVEVFLNGARLLSTKVHPDRPSMVILRAVTLVPGRNTICFATPNAAERRGQENVTYVLGDDLRIGTLTLALSLQLPRAGAYHLQVHPIPLPSETPVPLDVSLDSERLSLSYASPHEGFTGSAVPRAAGRHEMRIHNAVPGTRYLVQVSQPAERPVPSVHGTATFVRRSPTNVSASITAPGPCVVVLNESYHPAWEARLLDPASGRARKLPHFLVNGFANGYALDRPGTFQVTFRFALQELFEAGTHVSLVTTGAALMAMVVGLIGFVQRKRP